MRTVAIVAGAWLVVSVATGIVVGWLLDRLGRRPVERLSDLAVADRLRPYGAHVEAAPIEPPVTTNGRRV